MYIKTEYLGIVFVMVIIITFFSNSENYERKVTRTENTKIRVIDFTPPSYTYIYYIHKGKKGKEYIGKECKNWFEKLKLGKEYNAKVIYYDNFRKKILINKKDFCD